MLKKMIHTILGLMRKNFNQLTEDYFEAERIAEEGIKDVSFSYDELFGKLGS